MGKSHMNMYSTTSLIFLMIQILNLCSGFGGRGNLTITDITTAADDELVNPGDSYDSPGTYYFGGLFNVHSSARGGGVCDARVNPRGLQRMYAMVYAINMINARQDILPNVTIGECENV